MSFSQFILYLYILALTTCVEEYHLNYHYENLPSLLSIDEDIDGTNLILPFNRSRNVGSEGHQYVKKFIIDHFQKELENEWELEIDRFEENNVLFENLIFTLNNPNAEEYIVLSSHYDSKKFENFEHVGATDSASTCAILLYVAKFIDQLGFFETGDDIFKAITASNLGIKFVFLDGKAPLIRWSDKDSSYGAKHLSEKWKKSGFVDKIRLLLLPNMLGSHRTAGAFSSHFEETVSSLRTLAETERELLRIIPKKIGNTSMRGLFSRINEFGRAIMNFSKTVIKDDHLHFHNKGINVLYLCPIPFPKVWNTKKDTIGNLEQNQLYLWGIILSDFIVQTFNEEW